MADAKTQHNAERAKRIRYSPAGAEYRSMMRETRPTKPELMALGLLFHLHPDWI